MPDTQTPQDFSAVAEFDHINLSEIDPTFKPIDVGYYTLQVNALTPKVITPKAGKNAGKSVLALNGSFTVVGDPNFAGRKLWKFFWTSNPVDVKDLRKLQDVTGVTQEAGETLSDWAARFADLNPPAEFKVFVGQEPDYRDPSVQVSVIKMNQAQPVGA